MIAASKEVLASKQQESSRPGEVLLWKHYLFRRRSRRLQEVRRPEIEKALNVGADQARVGRIELARVRIALPFGFGRQRHGAEQERLVRQCRRNPAGSFSVHRLHQDLKSQGHGVAKETVHSMLDLLVEPLLHQGSFRGGPSRRVLFRFLAAMAEELTEAERCPSVKDTLVWIGTFWKDT